MLEKEPENRVPNAAALARALSGDTSAIPAPTEAAPAQRTSSQDWQRPYEVAPTSPLPVAHGAVTHYQASSEEVARWMAPEVRKFRSSFGTFAFVNAVIVIASIFGHSDYYVVTVFWSMIMAFKYSKLWNAGYDWRDVFRQPRDRRLVDVAWETIDEARGLFDKERRAMPRPPRAALPPMPPMPGSSAQQGAGFDASRTDMGPYRGTVQRAEQDRNEILRMVGSLPASDQSLVEGVVPATEALFQRIQLLAQGAAADEKSSAPEALAQIEAQISELEAQANPLEVRASEDRVRRLALLKRQRRGAADLARRHADTQARSSTAACSRCRTCVSTFCACAPDPSRMRAITSRSSPSARARLPKRLMLRSTARSPRAARAAPAAPHDRRDARPRRQRGRRSLRCAG